MHVLKHVRFRHRRAAAAARLLLLAAAIAASGCASRTNSNLAVNPTVFDPPDTELVSATPAQQRLGPNDKVRITVFQVPDMTNEYTVDASGNIEFPLVGTVAARGLLPTELGEQLAQRLGQRYLRSPSVTVTMLETAQQTITVDGAVNQPGVVPIRGATTLMRAVALARGTSQDANTERVVIFRTINGQRMAAAFNLRAIRRAEVEDPAVYGNDIVVVDGSRTRGIWREVMGAIPILGIFAPYLAR